MVERKTRVPGRHQHSHGSGTGIRAGTSVPAQGGSGDEQGVPALVSGDSPSLWAGAGGDTGSPLEVSFLPLHGKEGWPWPVMALEACAAPPARQLTL